jgi:hypothetical protein
MDTIHGLLVLIVFGISIYSMISYGVRRGSNKHAFKRLSKEGVPVRKLTPAEKQALDPFLYVRGESRPLKLRGEDVYMLTGKFLRHGIQGQNAKTMHDTIGGVDVVLPYDAAYFLSPEENRAEVVLAGKLAIVVSLNNVFDLAGGQARDQEAKAQDLQWKKGETGEFAEEKPGDSAREDDRATVHIYGQRDETKEETAQRNTPGIGFVPALCLILAVVAALVAAAHLDARAIKTGAGAAAIVFGILSIFSFRRAGHKWVEPKPVNRAKGYINTFELPSTNNPEIPQTKQFLGSKLLLHFPAHWLRFMDKLPDKALDVDVRVADNHVLKIESLLSIEEEYNRFPAVYWGRHLTILLAAVIGAIIVYANMPNPVKDFILARHTVLGTRMISLNDDQSGAAAKLHRGNLVQIDAPVRCQLPRQLYSGELPPPDCRNFRWGGTFPKIPELAIDDKLRPFMDKSAFKANGNRLLSLLAQIERAKYRNRQINPYGFKDSILVFPEMGDLALKVEDLCSLPAVTGSTVNQNRCSQLKDMLITKVSPLHGKKFESWDALIDNAKKKTLKKEKRDQGMVLTSVKDSMAEKARDIAESAVFADASKKFDEARAAVHGGIILESYAGAFRNLTLSSPRGSMVATWDAYRRLGDVQHMNRLTTTGLVIDNSPDESGTPVLLIDEEYSPELAISSTIRVGILGVLALAAILHILLMVINYNRDKERRRGVEKFIKARLG